MTEDEKRRVKSDVIEAMRIAIEDSLSPVAHVPDNMAIAYKAAEAGFAAGLEALAGLHGEEGVGAGSERADRGDDQRGDGERPVRRDEGGDKLTGPSRRPHGRYLDRPPVRRSQAMTPLTGPSK